MNKPILKKYFTDIAIILIIAIFFIADRLFKALALNIKSEDAKIIIDPIFLFNFTENRNIAFSLPFSGPVLNIVIICLILGIIFIIGRLIFRAKKLTLEAMILTFILFGAISNIVDRLQYGFVIDYLEIKNFTIFNLADVMISGGALFLILKNFQSIKKGYDK
jgi:signal peptidase II